MDIVLFKFLDRWIEPFITEQEYQNEKGGFISHLKRRKRKKMHFLIILKNLKTKINFYANDEDLQKIFKNWELIKAKEIELSDILLKNLTIF